MHDLKPENTLIERIENMTFEELNDPKIQAFRNILLRYGTAAVIHYYIMHHCLTQSDSKDFNEKFIEEYSAKFYDNPNTSFNINVNPVKLKGLYITKHYFENGIELFDRDHGNLTLEGSFFNEEERGPLFNRIWKPKDLLDKELLIEGKVYSKKLFQQVQHDFFRYQKGYWACRIQIVQPQSVEFKAIGEKLIEYNLKIMDHIDSIK